MTLHEKLDLIVNNSSFVTNAVECGYSIVVRNENTSACTSNTLIAKYNCKAYAYIGVSYTDGTWEACIYVNGVKKANTGSTRNGIVSCDVKEGDKVYAYAYRTATGNVHGTFLVFWMGQ